jgi:hypothetical protein
LPNKAAAEHPLAETEQRSSSEAESFCSLTKTSMFLLKLR